MKQAGVSIIFPLFAENLVKDRHVEDIQRSNTYTTMSIVDVSADEKSCEANAEDIMSVVFAENGTVHTVHCELTNQTPKTENKR